ncbi:uncharacterized protein LOC119988059 [Tripterygium wilfordii]|uniref:uncharacterized protein LOC119988059 n=1 Tax=Tripterygium wilfordii TaxID=458696 RepID=UPI0018F803D0|nr:uncharacterized protein LOC119988059 [Tripterygium wilfordii]
MEDSLKPLKENSLPKFDKEKAHYEHCLERKLVQGKFKELDIHHICAVFDRASIVLHRVTCMLRKVNLHIGQGIEWDPGKITFKGVERICIQKGIFRPCHLKGETHGFQDKKIALSRLPYGLVKGGANEAYLYEPAMKTCSRKASVAIEKITLLFDHGFMAVLWAELLSLECLLLSEMGSSEILLMKVGQL